VITHILPSSIHRGIALAVYALPIYKKAPNKIIIRKYKFLQTVHGRRQLRLPATKPKEQHQILLKVRSMNSG